MPEKASPISKSLRFISALMAVLCFCTTFGSVAVLAEDAAPVTAVEEVTEDTVSVMADEEAIPQESDDVTAGEEENTTEDQPDAEEPSGDADTATDAESSADSETTTDAEENPGVKVTVDAAEDGSVSGTMPDGTSISVDADGNAVLDMSGMVKSDSTQEMEDGVDYTDPTTGATIYKLEDFLNDEDDADVEYVDDTDAFMAWMDTPTMTSEELAAAMEQANAYDLAVLQNCYEPVENDVAVQSAAQPIVLDGEVPPETAEDAEPETPNVTYRLKDEYAVPVQAEDDIAFSASDDVALLSGDGYQSPAQSATIMVIGSDSLYLHVVDENGNGITGASVSYSFDGSNDINFGRTETLTDGNAQSAGMLKINTSGLQTDNAAIFLNISCSGYYGITRMADIVEIGSVLTYTLRKQDPNASGVYLRGSYIDGVDTKGDYTLMLTAKNTNRYDITAVVGVAGKAAVNDLPDTMTMSTANKTNPGYGIKTFFGGSRQKGGDYAIYTFTNTWSHYTDTLSKATLRKGDTLHLDKLGDYDWLITTKTDSGIQTDKADTVSMGITAELPDLDYIGYASNISFGLCGTSGAKISLPDDFLGGDSTINTDLLSVPFYVYVSLQGSALLGMGAVLTLAETDWLQDDNNNPQAQNPGTQAKTETLINRIGKQTKEARSVKNTYKEKQKRRANLSDKMKEEKQNGKKVMTTTSASIDWTGAVLAIGRYDLRSYRVTLELGLEMDLIGDAQATAYLLIGPVPVYAGVEFYGTGGGTIVVGAQTGELRDTSDWSFSSTSGGTLNLMIMLELVIGVGQRGILGLEGFANGDIALALKAQNSNARPAGKSVFHFQVDGGVTAGLRVRLFFLTYTKSWNIIDKRLYDSWGVYDGGDPDSPSTPDAQSANSGELPAYSVLLADPEVRAAAADAANQEYGVYAETLDGIEPEVSIAEDGTQQDLRTDEPALLADETAGQSGVTGIDTMEKSKVLTGSDFQYIADDEYTYLFRIATVEDKKMGRVARVVYSKGDANGQSSQVTALPATEEKNGDYSTWYGYDTNFAVAKSSHGERNIAYIAIVSAPSADTTDIAKQAAQSRLRVLSIDLRTGSVQSNVLVEKAPLNGKTDYAYTGTPAVFGCREDRYDNYYNRSPHSYMVACAVTTDVAALANGTLTRGNDAIAIATNRKSNLGYYRDDMDASIVWQDGIRRTNLTFTNLKINSETRDGWGLVSVDADQPETMDILDIGVRRVGFFRGKEILVTPNNRFSVISGILSNVQHPSQNYGNEVYFTCDGDLYTLVHDDNTYNGFKQLTDKTDVGDDVMLPSGDGLTLLGLKGDSAQNMLAVYTTARGRNITDDDGKTQQTVTDMAVRVYTLQEKDGGGYTVSGPRESVIENRAPVKTTAVGIEVGNGGNNLVRVMYLANQNFIQTLQPSGSIADDSYTAGTVQDTSDMYMWELRPGRAAELGGFTPTTSTIQRNRQTEVECDINVNNVGSYALKNVTVEVRKDSPTGALVGSYVVETKGDSFSTLGPGSDMNTKIKIPIGQDWDGVVTLYAAITKADGQDMSADYTPVWIGTDQLIKEGKVTVAVSQTADDINAAMIINGQLYNFKSTTANVRIGYEASVDPRKLKVRITPMRFNADGKEYWDTAGAEERSLSTCRLVSGNATVNLAFQIGYYWQQGVTALKFDVLGDNDVTLNCMYTTSQILLSPQAAEIRNVDSGKAYDAEVFRVVVRNQDSYYGTVETNRDVVLKNDTAQTAMYADESAANNTVNDTATLTATPRAGYTVDHWEYLSGNENGQNIWTRLDTSARSTGDPNVCVISYADFIEESSPADGSAAGDIGNTIIVQAVYAADSSTNVRVMTDVQSTADASATLQEATVQVLTADGNSKTGISTAGGIAYDVAKNNQITLRVIDYEPLNWEFDGWYAYTLDAYGNRTVGEQLSNEETYTLAPTENQYIMAKLRPRTEALVYLDAAGGTTGDEATDENQLCLQRADADRKIYLPKLTREGRIFEGWSSSKNGFPEGNSYVIAEDGEIFTALWGYEHASVYTWAEEGGTTSGNVYDVLPDTQVTVKAYPYDGWKFDYWAQYDYSKDELVRIDGAGAEYTFTMGAETVSLCAVFAKIDPATPGGEDKPSSTPKPADATVDASKGTTTAENKDNAADQAQAASGSTSAKQTIIPRTADDFPLVFVIVLLAVGACGFVAVVVLQRKRRKK